MKKIAIIGAGNVGKVLGYSLKNKGYQIIASFSRTEKARQVAAKLFDCPVFSKPEEAVENADIVFLTTPDQAIKEVCDCIAVNKGFTKNQVVLHASGAHSSEILLSARKQGAGTLSLHPLQTFPELEAGLRSLPGTFFAVEGDEDVFGVAAEMVQALGGQMLSIPTDMKVIYHAAACVACNYLTSLMDMALKMYGLMEIPPKKAFESLSPLIYSTLNNIGKLGPEKALTGPVSRGDLTTINSHLEALTKHAPELLSLYKLLGSYTVNLAIDKGTLDREQVEKLNTLLGGKE
ncbi:MAG: DUF2520 domain-containing protein [Firmicutes bacterium]|nr:DUF2520 domain-containing protein [Bacillota bacterium]